MVEYQTRPDVEVENIQQVRAVHDGDEWMLHIVCRKEIAVEESGDGTAGIDLGIKNYLAIAYSTDTADLYSGNKLKEDKHYFTGKEY